MPAQDAAPVSGVFPESASFHLLEIRVQAIQLLAISRGSRNAPSHTPGHGRYFPGMLLSPSGFPSRSAIRPRNLPSSPSRLSRGYNRAPRGAVAAEADMSAHRSDGCLCRTGRLLSGRTQDRAIAGEDLTAAHPRRPGAVPGPSLACRVRAQAEAARGCDDEVVIREDGLAEGGCLTVADCGEQFSVGGIDQEEPVLAGR